MPRRAAADFSVMLPGQPVARLRPPPDLTPDARETFLTIVGSVPAAKFQPSDVYLLAAYVRAVELEREASQRLREEGTTAPMARRHPRGSRCSDRRSKPCRC
jgi:hypothetical protein